MAKLATVLAILVLARTAVLLQGAIVGGDRHSDREAIIQVAHDYIDGFYEGDAQRMRRALHPDLAKRDIVGDRVAGHLRVRNMTAQQLIDVAASSSGKQTAQRDAHECDVTILDIFHDVATVKVVAVDWVDYLHLARVDGEWKIINALWAVKPET